MDIFYPGWVAGPPQNPLPLPGHGTGMSIVRIGQGDRNATFVIFTFVFCLYYQINSVLNVLHLMFEKRKLWLDLIRQSTRLDYGFRWVRSKMLSIPSSGSSRRTWSGSRRFRASFLLCSISCSCHALPTLVPIYSAIEMFSSYPWLCSFSSCCSFGSSNLLVKFVLTFYL